MQKKVTITGMMCQHCKKAVEDALRQVEKVTDVSVDLQAGEAIVTLSGAVEDAVLQQAVEAEDFTVTGIQSL